MDDHQEHLDAHLKWLPAPPEFYTPHRSRRQKLKDWVLRRPPQQLPVGPMLDAHIQAHQKMVDDVSGVHDVSRGRPAC